MTGYRSIQLLPEIHIFNPLTVRQLPAALFPTFNPQRNAID
jgi:hypothetical protein